MRLLVLAVVAGCAHAPPPRCELPLATGGDVILDERPVLAGPIASVAIEGAPTLEPLLRGVIETHTGQELADAPLHEDVRRLWAAGVLADVRVDARETAAGIALVFAVTPQRRIPAVHGADAPELRRLRWLAGAPYDPRRIARIAGEIRAAYIRDGHLDATVVVHRTPSLDLCVVAKPGPAVTIHSLTFPGAHAVHAATLLGTLHGKGVNHPGGTYDADALDEDQMFLLNEYYERGMVNAKVGEAIVERHGNALDIAIPITEGPRFHLGWFSGLAIPHGIAKGDLFVRSKLAAAIDDLSTRLDAYVTPVTHIDLDAHRIDITFQIEWRHPWSVLRLLSSR